MPPSLQERLQLDLTTAIKGGDRLRLNTLRLLKAGLQRICIEKKKDVLSDPEIVQIIAQQAKQRRETIEAAKQGNRQDILDQTTQELAILSSYLPPQLSEEALQQLIEEALQAIGPVQGAVMKHVMAKAAGSADGKVVRQLVTQRLQRHS